MPYPLLPSRRYQDFETPSGSLPTSHCRLPRTAFAAVAISTVVFAVGMGSAARAQIIPFNFSNGNVDGKMAMASRPSASGKGEIEAADDFVTTSTTTITTASFIGLLPAGATINSVDVEIYRVFPLDSTNPPDGAVPTRTNSPSDNAFQTRTSTTAGQMTFSTSLLNSSFTAANSVLNGINKSPNQTTGGEGAVTGQEVQFNVTFTTPFVLPTDHYFFVPQVDVTGANNNFFWLSSVRPITSPGTPFTPDLQAWIRNSNLDPDWLRVGTDIVGGTTPPTFNGQFTLGGTAAPEPSAIALMISGISVAGIACRRRRKAR